MNSQRRWGDHFGSVWQPTTLDAAAVSEIAASQCRGMPLLADASLIAGRINEAAADLLASLQGHAKPSDAEIWGNSVADACAALVTACGHPPVRAAARLGLPPEDWQQFAEMLATVRRVQTIANMYTVEARAAKAETTAARPAPENHWLARMVDIFSGAFAREAGITKNEKHERGGPCPRFIAAVAQRLLADTGITPAREPSVNALRRFSDAKTVAGRLAGRRQSREAAP